LASKQNKSNFYKWRYLRRLRESKQKAFWGKWENCLKYYERHCSPASWKCFIFREGSYLLTRFVVLSISFILITYHYNWQNIGLIVLTSFFLFDIIIANTSISFITIKPINTLRSYLFTFFTFTNIILIYSVFYKFVQRDFSSPMCNTQVLYFSTVTISTLGFGDFVPNKSGTNAQWLVIFEILTGFFFITGVFARIISMKDVIHRKQ
jgi:hypothetical protein